MKTMVFVVISLLLIALVTLFWPSTSNDDPNVSVQEDTSTANVEQETTTEKPLSPEVTPPSSDEKIALMTSTYERLEKSRKNLKRRLARLKHEMWGLKFPPDQAKMMSDVLLNAHKLIKNPDMLGAFSSVEGIEDEIAKIQFADKSLDELSEMVESNKKETGIKEEF